MKFVARLVAGLTLALAGAHTMAQSAPIFAYEHLTNPDASVFCSCEHYGSQYDGICAAQLYPYDSTIWNWSWESYGNAWLPYPTGQDGTAYYDSYGYGGLNVRAEYVKSGFYYINTETGEKFLWWPTSTAIAYSQCGNGTVGWPN